MCNMYWMVRPQMRKPDTPSAMKNCIGAMALLALFTMVFGSCAKVDVPKGTPRCIKKLIKDREDHCLKAVYKYRYQGTEVYLFLPDGCPDLPSVAYNEKCGHICNPDGGLSGNGDGICPEFFSNITDEELIWFK